MEMLPAMPVYPPALARAPSHFVNCLQLMWGTLLSLILLCLATFEGRRLNRLAPWHGPRTNTDGAHADVLRQMAQTMSLAVCGLHLRGQPLNGQLTSLGATFCRECWSAPCYRLFALTDAARGTAKPGMVRVAAGGVRVFLEVWSVPVEQFGRFMLQVPAPLGIGTVQLEDGGATHGFICEGIVAEGGPGVEDISHLGSWLEYVRLKKGAS